MKKPKGDAGKGPGVDDDLDVFEELEGNESIDDEPATERMGIEGVEDDLDISDIDIPAAAGSAGEAEFQADPSSDVGGVGASIADLAPDVPVNVVAVIGKKMTNVGELMKYRVGHAIDLGRPPGETVDLVANGRLIARGELVEIDGKLGVKILKLAKL